MSRESHATVDFETRSCCDLKTHGSWRYSLDPTTDVLCLAFHLPHWSDDATGLWIPAFPHLGLEETDAFDNVADLVDWVGSGGLLEAHNSWFERGIWQNILVPRHGFPPVQHHQWRCSAAAAAAVALPRSLGEVAKALRLAEEKDAAGHALMRKMSKPREPLKREIQEWENQHGAGTCVGCKGKGTYKRKPCERCGGLGIFPGDPTTVPPMPVLWHESVNTFVDLWAYCGQDVRAERAVSAAIPPLPPSERDLYLLDQTINERGFYLDTDAVGIALRLIAQETKDLNDDLAVLTGGAVTKATQRAKMLAWLQGQGVKIEDTQGPTIDAAAESATDPVVQMALGILRDLGRSSTAKYQAMQRWVCPDGRVRGGLLYHGATTGRWSGAGVQPHNFVRGTVKDQHALWETLKTGNRETIRAAYGSVMLALANGLRGAICAAPGHDLYVADYAQIEARVLLWLAGDTENLDTFRSGADIYCEMASHIYNRKITKADAQERQLGKAAVLGCGYQMGGPRFQSAAAAYGVVIDTDMSQQTVDAYREKFWRVVEMWGDQEAAAREAIGTRAPVRAGRVTWTCDDRFLYCLLPSGRRLAYPFPQLQWRTTKWGSQKLAVTFEGVDPYTHQWKRQATYGGMIVENQVQAVARDIMAEAMLRCERTRVYLPILSVHDELISEVTQGAGDLKMFESLLTQPPTWAPDCPIVAEGYVATRYRK